MASEVISRLKRLTCAPSLSKRDIDQRATFIGRVEQSTFRVSLKVDAPENFLPIIDGEIDETSMGCIVYLKFKLFFSSIMFLTLWSAICLLIFLFFLFIVHEKAYAITALLVGLANYFVTLFYFSKKVKESHNVLMQTLKMD
ncbi:hypothetical protein E1176_12670 [Fulvivirga sp. RKSG066]|nr:hypothetical protein [Fulvivirga aurantia]